MTIKYILITATILLVSCATEGVKEANISEEIPPKSISRYAFFNKLDYGAEHMMCVKHNALSSCLNITSEQCSESFQKYSPDCKSKLEPYLPKYMSREIADQFLRDFADCVTYGAIKERGMKISQVDACIKQRLK